MYQRNGNQNCKTEAIYVWIWIFLSIYSSISPISSIWTSRGSGEGSFFPRICTILSKADFEFLPWVSGASSPSVWRMRRSPGWREREFPRKSYCFIPPRGGLLSGGIFTASPFLQRMGFKDPATVYSKETKSLVINVVNRHKDEAISTEIINSSGTFIGKASVSEINRTDIRAVYKFDEQAQYIPVTKELAVKGNKITYSFPAHSFTQIIVKTDY